MAELYVASFSPWSEKARWALDHHGVTYALHEYVPLLSEPGLRLRLGAFGGKVSVPTLVGASGAFCDSFDIAQEAERVGQGAPLFPEARLPDILAWNQRSERALTAARVRVVQRMSEIAGADGEALPAQVPDFLRPVLRRSTALGLWFLREKYDLARDQELAQSSVRGVLDDLRSVLSGRAYLLDSFSYADITMAVILQTVRPVADAYLPLGPATREVWTNAELGREFADLLAWRDDLYARHRRPR